MAVEFQPETDGELARQSQDGSLAAFESLVARYENRLYAFVYQACRHEADAREITQDTFVRAFQAIAQFDPRQPFAPWLFTIARRKCVDCYRAKIPGSEELPLDAPDTDDPAQLMARREEAGELWLLARRALPDLQYQALWLRYAEEMSVQQAARVLGKTATHVKILLFRARHTLAGRLPQPATRAPTTLSPRRPPLTAFAKGGHS